MRADEITDTQLRDFLEWHKDHYQRETVRVALVAISAAGHFHMTEKTATPLVYRAIKLGFLERDGKDNVKWPSGTTTKKKR